MAKKTTDANALSEKVGNYKSYMDTHLGILSMEVAKAAAQLRKDADEYIHGIADDFVSKSPFSDINSAESKLLIKLKTEPDGSWDLRTVRISNHYHFSPFDGMKLNYLNYRSISEKSHTRTEMDEEGKKVVQFMWNLYLVFYNDDARKVTLTPLGDALAELLVKKAEGEKVEGAEIRK